MIKSLTASNQLTLTGQDNFVAWKKFIKGKLIRSGYTNADGTLKTDLTPAQQLEATYTILDYVCPQIITVAPDDQGPQKLLDFIDSYCNLPNTQDAIRKFKAVTMNGIEPHPFLAAFGEAISLVKLAGGKISPVDAWDAILNNIHQDFYTQFIRQQRLENTGEITDAMLERTISDLKRFFNATPETTRQKYATKTAALSTKKSPRYCKICAEKYPQYSTTHDTKFHRDDWKPKPKENKEATNKASQPYFDSGASQHFFKDKPPINYVAINDSVSTASGESLPIVGKGSVQIGDLLLTNVYHVPGFVKNLVSASKLTQDGYTAIISQGGLQILKDGEEVATGTLNNNENLFKLNQFEAYLAIDQQKWNEYELKKKRSPCKNFTNDSDT